MVKGAMKILFWYFSICYEDYFAQASGILLVKLGLAQIVTLFNWILDYSIAKLSYYEGH